MPFHLVRIRCPRCGSASRTLRLAGSSRRHHQCLRCGHRHEQLAAPPAAVASRHDKYAGLAALPPPDRALVEGLVLLMVGTGTLVGAVELVRHELTQLRREHGAPSAVLRGFAFPVFSWIVEQAARHAMHFVAIDQGRTRVCFRVRRKRPTGPL